MNMRAGIVLVAALVACALLLVTSQHQSRRLFIELERSQAQAKQLDIEWRQLQLEQSTLGKHGRIEMSARQELKMLPVNARRTQYLEARQP